MSGSTLRPNAAPPAMSPTASKLPISSRPRVAEMLPTVYAQTMSEGSALTVAIDPALHAELVELAGRWKVDLDHVVATALHRLVNDESVKDPMLASLPVPPPEPGLEVLDDAAQALRKFIQVGIDSLRNEPAIDHEDLMAELLRRDKAALERKKKSAA